MITLVLRTLRRWKDNLKTEVLTLYFAARHPRTPVYAKLAAAAVVAYALSPIDLIPDFIPVLGYLDDLIIVPAGIALVLRLVPAGVLVECRAKAQSWSQRLERSLIAGAIIVTAWLMLAMLLVRWLLSL